MMTADQPSMYEIIVQGKKGKLMGTVEIWPDRIVRLCKPWAGRAVGVADTQIIPMRSITAVHHHRRRFGVDRVVVWVGTVFYEWLALKDAERMVAELNERMLSA